MVKSKSKKMLKVIYFDEKSASDYIDIFNDGHLNWTTGKDKEKIAKFIAEIEAELGGGFNFLTWMKASLYGKANTSVSSDTKMIIETKITNTILTDYLNIANEDKNIRKFFDIVYAPLNSISLYKIFSPYTIIVPFDQQPIDLEKLNLALDNAKGYYEMLLSNESEPKNVLRFNIQAFRNNYNLSDLTKMKLVYYGVCVGECEKSKLDMAKEFEFTKVLPSAEEIVDGKKSSDKKLKVFDIVLAGIEQ